MAKSKQRPNAVQTDWARGATEKPSATDVAPLALGSPANEEGARCGNNSRSDLVKITLA